MSGPKAASAQLLQRGLVALGLALALVLLIVLARRRLLTQEEQSRARHSLLVEILANVSEGLGRLETGLDDIAVRTAAAKNQLSRLTDARRQNLLACALLRERKVFQDEYARKKVDAASIDDPAKSNVS
ncbi:uncharacterized protein LOC111693884 [Trichogramma pretiosum]|uniref:uncharacterized protein LOC111693884 n=1 Tax=Trichogramma pretiosum TaxID=7493 RepID=UPI000C71C18B|nr:uncharacterized protein LOC111693884 [Trichogramma pretiosum]